MPTRLYPIWVTSGGPNFNFSTRTGSGSFDLITTTTAGGTNIPVTFTAGGASAILLSPRITQPVTISGTITVNIRGRESANTVNAGRGILIERTNADGVVLSTILSDRTVPATITEFTTTDAANGAATYTPTSTAMAAGDRIQVTFKIRNVGTMGAGTATISFSGTASGAAGDTWVQFNENFVIDDVMRVPAFEYRQEGYYG